MTTTVAWLVATLHATTHTPHGRLRGDHGEGVISAAIAVLIMAFLGALMWIGFQNMWVKVDQKTNDRIDHISTDR